MLPKEVFTKIESDILVKIKANLPKEGRQRRSGKSAQKVNNVKSKEIKAIPAKKELGSENKEIKLQENSKNSITFPLSL